MDRRLLLLALVALLPALLSPPAVSACNEAVCASIVSKCTLLKSCECKPEPGQPCTCCERCKKCLDYSFTECCSCFELCPKRNVTEAIPESAVFEFKHPEPELWDALVGAGTASSSSGGSGDGDGSSGSGGTSGGSGGDLDQWERFTYPVDVHRSQLETKKKKGHYDVEGATPGGNDIIVGEQETVVLSKEAMLVTVECNVVFLRQCVSNNKCKASCETMGATAGRWFEDGCCECIGHNCNDYGINESRCPACSFDDHEDDLILEDLSDEELEQLEEQYADMYDG